MQQRCGQYMCLKTILFCGWTDHSFATIFKGVCFCAWLNETTDAQVSNICHSLDSNPCILLCIHTVMLTTQELYTMHQSFSVFSELRNWERKKRNMEIREGYIVLRLAPLASSSVLQHSTVRHPRRLLNSS